MWIKLGSLITHLVGYWDAVRGDRWCVPELHVLELLELLGRRSYENDHTFHNL